MLLCVFFLSTIFTVNLHAQVTSPDFSIVLLPDTQNESQFFPNVLNTEIQWIVDNRAAQNIQAVLGLGDIVNLGTDPAQQQNADAAIRLLDNAGVPYFLALGNHDYDIPNTSSRAVTGFNQWWGPARYAGKSYYQGSFPAGSNENFYGVLTINSTQYLVLVLEYDARDTALNWASSVVQANLDKEIIVVTHSFLFEDGTRNDVCDTQDTPSDNYGASLWDKFVSKYPNIIMVVNGHFTDIFAARRADLGVNGNLVNQMFSNYQDVTNGGNGWLRILTFRPATNTIDVQTYSPFLNSFMLDAANQFTVNYHNPGFATGQGTITGRVRSTTCQSLAGATVTAGSASATTDVNGGFTLSLPPANYTLNVTAPGYNAGSRAVQVNDNYDTNAKVYLTAAPPCTLNTASPSVTICTPANSATVASPLHLVAGSTDSNPVVRMEAWIDGVKMYTQSGNTLDTNLKLADGTHRVVAVAAESSGFFFSQAINITVNSTSSSAPTVQLSANPTAISGGQSSTLSWTSTNATSVSIQPGGGTFGPTGTLTVTPSGTTTYTATATGAGGSTTSSATVTVQSRTAPCTLSTVNQTVTICTPANNTSVTSPVHVVAGATDSTPVIRMEAWVDGVKVYTQAGNSLDTNLDMTAATHRIAVVAAESSTVYYSSAINVTVTPPIGTAPTVSLTASPTSIPAGQSSTLTWSSTNATSVSIAPGVGTFGASGSVSVTPSATTTYTATATGAAGSATASATVTVQAASSTCVLSTVNHTVTICTPSNNATVSNPVHIVAGSTDATGTVVRMEVWVDGVKQFTQLGNSLDANLTLGSGTHRVTVVAAESSTSYFSQAIFITVSP